jgi:AcrR family transcriptional regulator
MSSSSSVEQGRRGRWRTGSESRRRIVAAAAARFAADGYQRTTIRAIAADANVDPAMIRYFFGGKQQLHNEVLHPAPETREPVANLLSEGADKFGERLVRRFLEVSGDDVQGRLATLARAAAMDSEPAGLLRAFIEDEFAVALAEQLGFDRDEARVRAALISVQLVGIAVARHHIRVEPFASASPDTVVAWLGPVVQRLVTDPLPENSTDAVDCGSAVSGTWHRSRRADPSE